MGALTIGTTTRDNDYTPWTLLYKKSRKQTRLEEEYYEAKREAESLWHEHTTTVDWGEDRLARLAEVDPVKYQEFKESYLWQLDELEKKAVVAERRQHRLYEQMNCNHEFEDYRTDADQAVLVCSKCGLKD
jgi:hypothetical protein